MVTEKDCLNWRCINFGLKILNSVSSTCPAEHVEQRIILQNYKEVLSEVILTSYLDDVFLPHQFTEKLNEVAHKSIN